MKKFGIILAVLLVSVIMGCEKKDDDCVQTVAGKIQVGASQRDAESSFGPMWVHSLIRPKNKYDLRYEAR